MLSLVRAMTWKSSSAPDSAVAVLCALEEDGFDLEAVNGRLRVSPAHQLTARHRAAIRRYREPLVVLVLSCDPGVLSRRTLFKRQWIVGRATIFLVCPNLGWQKGRCFSCADDLNAQRYGRCWRCSLAWRWAAGVFDRLTDERATQNASTEDLVA